MKPTFKAQPMQVQVPATSANLGPGFDCLGLALNMHDRYMAQVMDESGVDIDVTGEGADAVPTSDKNLVIKAMYKGFDFLGGRPRGISLRQLNVIPHGRGLGSSAAGLAGLIKYKKAGKLPKDKTIVITVTGHGLKDIPYALEAAKKPVVVPVNAKLAAKALGLA